MPKKQKQSGLGKALIKKLQRQRYIANGDRAPIFYQQTEENEAQKKKMKMKSVLEQNNLAEYMQVAEMSQQDFHANRNIKFSQIREEIKNKKIIVVGDNKKKKIEEGTNSNVLKGLQVPRRPQWKKAESKEALEKLENQAYLNWRRKLAAVEESSDDLWVTPYEKNLQVWRQLWRVVERSDVLCQIIDGRNPLFFYSQDLFEYAREVGKNKFLLIINKSDLVQQKIRQQWNQYFLKKGIDHCFFTAKQDKILDNEEHIKKNTPKVLSPHQLIDLLSQYGVGQAIQIGLTGYPNVGKSSVINALIGRKKVGVASMPGKTKHFQTLKLTQEVTLCDCPGLVFPKVHASKAEMILCGLYSIDTLKQYDDPMDMIAYQIPRQFVEQCYAIHWKQKQPYDGDSILSKYAILKGFYGGSGQPNKSKAARTILKDYINGVLVFAHPPPGENNENLFLKKKEQIILQKDNYEKKEERVEQNLDQEFFEKEQINIRTAEEMINSLNQEDFLDIVQGRKLDGFKVTKQMRKQIKFSIKRGAALKQLQKILMGQNAPSSKILMKL